MICEWWKRDGLNFKRKREAQASSLDTRGKIETGICKGKEASVPHSIKMTLMDRESVINSGDRIVDGSTGSWRKK